MTISTSVWSAQHPKAGQSIQHIENIFPKNKKYSNLCPENFTNIKMFFRLKKKDNDMLNANDRIHVLEDELRNIGSKMSRLEDDHHKVIQELNVRHLTF